MGDREDGIARRKSLGIKAAAVTVGVVAALASLSSGACADSSVAFFPRSRHLRCRVTRR